jgi:catechol 2,3-dioxygenase-like lactoylglutathione lyase family enzyme
MCFRALDHVGVTVSSLERSIPFYTELLGEGPLARLAWGPERDAFVGHIIGYERPTIEAAFFGLPGGSILELLEYHHPPSARPDMETYNVGNAHLGLRTDDIHREYDRLRDLVAFRHDAPVEIPSGPAKGGYAIYMRDPDGITIEIVQAPPSANTHEELSRRSR